MLLAAQLGSTLSAAEPSLEQLYTVAALLEENDVQGLRDYLDLYPELAEGDTTLAVLLRRFLIESSRLPTSTSSPTSPTPSPTRGMLLSWTGRASRCIDRGSATAHMVTVPIHLTGRAVASVSLARSPKTRASMTEMSDLNGLPAVPLPGRELTASRARRRVALLVDARFPGGTGSAVAAEIRALAPRVELAVFGARDRDVPRTDRRTQRSPRALEEVGPAASARAAGGSRRHHRPAQSDLPEVRRSARTAAQRGPHRSSSPTRTSCGPAGARASTSAIASASSPRGSPGARSFSPRSRRPTGQSVAAWLGADTRDRAGASLGDDWPNICDQPFLAPTPAPRDRRGRHSRPGFEKFPPLAALRAQFSAACRALRDSRRRHPAARSRGACRRTGSCCASGR